MDKKLLTICSLFGLTAILALAHLLVTTTAQAGPVGSVVSNRDFSVVTGKSSNGTDSIYILDNRRSLVAVFQYDVAAKIIKPQVVRPLSEVLSGR